MGKRGPKGFEPTDQQRKIVKQWAAVGMPQEAIAKKLGITIPTLAKHCREELDNGANDANSAVAGALFNKAMGGDTSAQIFWCKTRLGWSEKQIQEHVGKGGKDLFSWPTK